MKRLFIISALILLICRCNDSGSDSDSSTGLKFNPDTLTSDDKYNISKVQKKNIISFDGTDREVNYTILFVNKVNDISYIALAASNNPALETFNLKIYFTGTEIPETAKTINSTNSTIKVTDSTGTYTWQSGTLSFNSFTKTDITTDNDKSYTTYTISISGTATLGTKLLSFPNPITARLVGSDDSSRK